MRSSRFRRIFRAWFPFIVVVVVGGFSLLAIWATSGCQKKEQPNPVVSTAAQGESFVRWVHPDSMLVVIGQKPGATEKLFERDIAVYDSLLVRGGVTPMQLERLRLPIGVYNRAGYILLEAIQQLDDAGRQSPQRSLEFAKIALGEWAPRFHQFERLVTSVDTAGEDGRNHFLLSMLGSAYAPVLERSVYIQIHSSAQSR